MQLRRVLVTIATKNFAFFVLCLAVCSLTLPGCSKAKEKDVKEDKKKVVQEMNIQTPADSTTPKTTGDSSSQPKSGAGTSKPDDGIESLPFESGETNSKTEEEELPVLGGAT